LRFLRVHAFASARVASVLRWLGVRPLGFGLEAGNWSGSPWHPASPGGWAYDPSGRLQASGSRIRAIWVIHQTARDADRLRESRETGAGVFSLAPHRRGRTCSSSQAHKGGHRCCSPVIAVRLASQRPRDVVRVHSVEHLALKALGCSPVGARVKLTVPPGRVGGHPRPGATDLEAAVAMPAARMPEGIPFGSPEVRQLAPGRQTDGLEPTPRTPRRITAPNSLWTVPPAAPTLEVRHVDLTSCWVTIAWEPPICLWSGPECKAPPAGSGGAHSTRNVSFLAEATGPCNRYVAHVNSFLFTFS
jgi:hypothetical protein